MKLLYGITGSVAAILAPKLIAELRNHHEVKVMITNKVKFFWDPGRAPQTEEIAEREEILKNVEIFQDIDEWRSKLDGTRDYYQRGDPVLHIELRKWADALLIAPLSANTLGKMANGLADNLLTSVLRAWERRKPIFLAPAMNTEMWCHPITKEHLSKLKEWYPHLTVFEPVSKILACRDEGLGAMASIDAIMKGIKDQEWIIHP